MKPRLYVGLRDPPTCAADSRRCQDIMGREGAALDEGPDGRGLDTERRSGLLDGQMLVKHRGPPLQ
jgi:hypothetical protein